MSEYCCTCGCLVSPSHFDLNLNHEQREEKSTISDEQIDIIYKTVYPWRGSGCVLSFERDALRSMLAPLIEAAKKEERERCAEICDYPSLGADSETAQEIKRRILSQQEGESNDQNI